MAMQHLVAYSQTVEGAGVAAGSIYGCGAQLQPESVCYYGGANIQASNRYIESRFAKGLIDNPIHLKNTPVLLFNGKDDDTVYVQCMQDVETQLNHWGVHTTAVFNTSATHVWSVDHGDCKCGACKNYLSSLKCCDVNNCDYDLSGDMFRHIYGDIKPRSPAPLAHLKWVNQKDFIPLQNSSGPASWSVSGMMKWGLVYANSACQKTPSACKVHVNYHGCIADKYNRRQKWSTLIDLNQYAEANDIIVVYPQAAGDKTTGKGCWNWGFTQDDQLFDTKSSVQLETVVRLVAGLEGALAKARPFDQADAVAGEMA